MKIQIGFVLAACMVWLISGCGPSGLEATAAAPTPRSVSSSSISDSLSASYYKNYPITVPSGATSLTVSIVNGSGDLDLYLKADSPLSGSSISQLNANTDYRSDGATAAEEITVTRLMSKPLKAGTWYAAVLNLNSTTTSFSLKTEIVTQDGSPSAGFVPQSGLWYNSKQPGHGVDIETTVDGSGKVTMAAVLYTYREDGNPTWYMAVSPITSASWVSDVVKYSWNGSTATPTKVGTVSIEFKDRTHATFQWTIDGHTVTEEMERFLVTREVAATSYTGLWYQVSKPGFGYSVDTQGNGSGRAEAVVAYFYDCSGNPVWAMVVTWGATDISSATVKYPLAWFTGSCPWCTYRASSSQQVGTVSRAFTSSTGGTMDTQINLPAPFNCAWNVNISDFGILSTEVDERRLELEMAIDRVLGVVNVGSGSLGDWSSVLEGLSSDGSKSTCPITSTTGPTGTGSATDPYKLSLTANFGSGCTAPDGSVWSGSAGGQATISSSGTNSFGIEVDATLTNVMRDGALLGTGSGTFDLALTSSGSNLASGTGSLSATGSTAEGPVSGSTGFTMTNVDLGTLMSGLLGGDTEGIDSQALLGALGTNGSVQIQFNKMTVGSYYADGTAKMSAQSATQQTVETNLNTNEGPVVAKLIIKNTSGTEYQVSTPTPANVVGYQASFENVQFDITKCANAPIGGSLVLTKGSNSGRFTFNGSCIVYGYQPL